jgi:S-adenosylmethionine-diacylglycerol 3-amino-3-carboxypropyl transferase
LQTEVAAVPLLSIAKTPPSRLKQAVHRRDVGLAAGMLERLFTTVFKGLVYPQIWEDPKIDLEALELRPGARLITIASGGCNVLSYLTAEPARIIAVDLNRAHVALTRLKLCAARHAPTYDVFYRFFGEARGKANIAAYTRYVRDHLDDETRRYWEARDVFGRRRITLFARNLYRHGLLGRFIGLSHFVARLYGIDPRELVQARSLEEQRAFFAGSLLPLFDKRLVRWATSKKISLYGLGIPPVQYEALASAGGGDMASVLRERLERLACGFPLADNYFAWQAFARGYAGGEGPLPPYLERAHFAEISGHTDRVQVVNRAFTEQLTGEPDGSLDAFVLLDAQDWMSDAQLDALWTEIDRTARPGARVIFRTAAVPNPLPGHVATELLDRWTYLEERSAALAARDRSSIYGGFHLLVRDG